MATKRLSRRQQEILDFIVAYIDGHGYPPAIRDIQHGCDISSTSVVDYNLKQLVEKGVIRRSQDIARSIEVVGHQKAQMQSIPLVDPLTARAPLGTYIGVNVDVVHPEREHVFPADAIAARIGDGSFTSSLLREGDVLVLHRDGGDGPVVVWSDDLAETVIGHMLEDGRLIPGPLCEPRDLGKHERLATILAVFRSY